MHASGLRPDIVCCSALNQARSCCPTARLRTLAAAEKDAASDHAAARLEQARAEADSEREKAFAKRESLLAEAEGQKALHEAENALEPRLIQMKEELARMETLPKAIAEMAAAV